MPEPGLLHLPLNRHTSLQVRNKWYKSKPNVQQGDVVIIKDTNTPPSQWLMGKVIQCFPGDDGHTRVVKVKTPLTEFTRAITKIIKMLVN